MADPTTNTTNISDVLSGNAPLQFQVSIEPKSLIYLGLTLVLVVVFGVVFWKLSTKI